MNSLSPEEIKLMRGLSRIFVERHRRFSQERETSRQFEEYMRMAKELIFLSRSFPSHSKEIWLSLIFGSELEKVLCHGRSQEEIASRTPENTEGFGAPEPSILEYSHTILLEQTQAV
jgi:hypothetical protein